MLSTNEPKMKFACSKCDKSYASKRALVNHNEKIPFCNVIETQTETDNKYDTLVKKVDILTEMVSNQSTQISTLLNILTDMKAHIITPVLSSIVVEQQIRTNEPIVPVVFQEQIKTNEPIVPVVFQEQIKTNEPLVPVVLQEQIKTNEIVVPVPVKKVKKIKKQAEATEATEQSKKTKHKFIYLPTEEDADLEGICPELRIILDKLQQEKGDKKPPVQMIQETLYFNNVGLFCYGDNDKMIIEEEQLPNFIDKCSSLEGQEAYYSAILKHTFNPDMGIFLDTETNRLYHIDEETCCWDWNESRLTNKIRCSLWDTLNSAVANSAIAYKDYTSKLFAIKHTNFDGSKSDELNERLLEFMKCCYGSFKWNK